MREREPVAIATQIALDEGWVDQNWLEITRSKALDEIAAVEAFADESEIARPPVEELLEGVFAR